MEEQQRTKIRDVKDQVLEFMNKIASLELQVEEKSVFTLFGLKLLKYKVLQFRTNGGWKDFS